FYKRLISYFEWTLLLLTLALLSIGVIAVYSATYEAGQHLSPWTIRQLSWAALGLLGMVVTFAVDYRRLERWAYPLYGFSLVLLLLVPVLGSFGGVVRRWINLGLLSLPPAALVQ